MIRFAPIDSCGGCPYLETVDAYASHHYRCSARNLETDEIGDVDTTVKVDAMLDEWFTSCYILPEAWDLQSI